MANTDEDLAAEAIANYDGVTLSDIGVFSRIKVEAKSKVGDAHAEYRCKLRLLKL